VPLLGFTIALLGGMIGGWTMHRLLRRLNWWSDHTVTSFTESVLGPLDEVTEEGKRMVPYLERHARTGIMTNQPDGHDQGRPHAATSVCARPECQRRAQQWVAATTNEPAVYVPDQEEE